MSILDFLRLCETIQTGEVGGGRLAWPSVLSRGVRALGARRLTSVSFSGALTRPGPVGSGIVDADEADHPLGNTSVAPDPIEDLARPQSRAGGHAPVVDDGDVDRQDQLSTPPLSQVGSSRHGDGNPSLPHGSKLPVITSSMLVLCASALLLHAWCQHEVWYCVQHISGFSNLHSADARGHPRSGCRMTDKPLTY